MLRRSKSEAEDRAVTGPARLLVVDDDADARELIARILEHATYSVERCADHGAAVQAVKQADPPFSGVVIDFQSGGTSSSLKLLDAIRHIDDKARAKTPTLILTATDTNQVFAWQSGSDGFIVRPFHSDDVVEGVHAMLERTADERDQHRRDQMKQARSAQARRIAE